MGTSVAVVSMALQVAASATEECERSEGSLCQAPVLEEPHPHVDAPEQAIQSIPATAQAPTGPNLLAETGMYSITTMDADLTVRHSDMTHASQRAQD